MDLWSFNDLAEMEIVNLSSRSLRDMEVKNLCQGLISAPKLKTILMGSNCFGDEGLSVILTFLDSRAFISKIVLIICDDNPFPSCRFIYI